jgi:hypothetical protein
MSPCFLKSMLIHILFLVIISHTVNKPKKIWWVSFKTWIFVLPIIVTLIWPFRKNYAEKSQRGCHWLRSYWRSNMLHWWKLWWGCHPCLLTGKTIRFSFELVCLSVFSCILISFHCNLTCQGVFEINHLHDKLTASYQFGGPSSDWVIPLHSSVASTEQKKVFLRPPGNIRKVSLIHMLYLLVL